MYHKFDVTEFFLHNTKFRSLEGTKQGLDMERTMGRPSTKYKQLGERVDDSRERSVCQGGEASLSSLCLLSCDKT
jgi:hypothetical protein